MILVKIATLIGLLLTYVTQATVDLFSNNHGSKLQSFRTSYDTEVSNCEASIVKEFQELNGTGVKVYRTSEIQLQHCPDICEHKDNINDFCQEKEPNFVSAFTTQTKSDRCCDERSCKCVCHFKCSTFESRAEEFRQAGFKSCYWGTSKKETLDQAAEKCKEFSESLDCQDPTPKFVCPRQFVCIGSRCLACINTACVSDEDEVHAKSVAGAYNKTEAADIEKIRLEEEEKVTESRTKNRRNKSYRGLETPKEEIHMEAGLEI